MASYPKPANTGSTFNSSSWVAPTINSADTAFLNANYCQYPTLQGGVNTKTITNTGTITSSSNIILNSGYIQFPDGSRQTTGTQDLSGYAYVDLSNNFTAINTFVGNNNAGGLSAPLRLKNSDNGDQGSLYLDPSGNYDITLFSNQSSNAGLTVRNPTYSFTVNPVAGNVANFINPVSCNYAVSALEFKTNSGFDISTNLKFPDGSVQTGAYTGPVDISSCAILTTTNTQNFLGPLLSTATNLPATDSSSRITNSSWVQSAISNGLTPYAPLASPIFSGNPQAPTPATTDNDTSIATTNYVKLNLNNYATSNNPVLTGIGSYNGQNIATTNLLTGFATSNNPVLTGVGTYNAQPIATTNLLSSYAPLASPILTGNPQAPTPATNDNDTTIATTAFVKANLLPLQGSLVSNTFTIFKGTINGSVSPITYVYTGNKYTTVLINNLVFSMTSTYQFLQMNFTNDLYTPVGLSATTVSVSGYIGTGSTLLAFSPYSQFTNSNQITLAPSQSLNTGTTYSAELYFTFYFT